MNRASSAWIVTGLALAGCGTDGGGDATPVTKPNVTVEAPAAKVELAAVTMPENTVGAATFLEAPEANEGRVAITGAVLQSDADKNRFLLCDQSEAGCIGGD